MSWVQDGARYVCYAILTFYALRVLLAIVFGQSGGHEHRLREAMALGYTAIAVYFIGSGTGAIQMFVKSVQATGKQLSVPDWANVVLAGCATVICVAFLCNFSRSLWMLKSLDHGVYEPITGWRDLTARSPKRQLFEFFTRTCAALLFIQVEHKLEELAQHTGAQDVRAAMDHALAPDYLSAAGWWGVALYLALLCWWITGWLIARVDRTVKMPPKQFWFFSAGLFNSAFIGVYGGEVATKDWEFIMLMVVIGMGAAAGYMLYVVAIDVFRCACIVPGKLRPLLRKLRPSEPATT